MEIQEKKNFFINIYKEKMKKFKADKFYFFSDQYLINIINLDFVLPLALLWVIKL